MKLTRTQRFIVNIWFFFCRKRYLLFLKGKKDGMSEYFAYEKAYHTQF